jgi:putative transposase
LQERRDAYRHPSQTRITPFGQFTALTGLRDERPDVFVFGVQPLRSTIRRVDAAFAGFFARVKAGQTPGYPRFKSWARFDTVTYDEAASWSLHLDEH